MKNEVKNVIIIAFVVVFITLITYLTTSVFMTGEIGQGDKIKDNDKKITEENSTSKREYDNMIIAGRVFNQPEESYKVILFRENKASDALKSAVKSYSSSGAKLYVVNLDETINKYVLGDFDNKSATNSKELKIKEKSLITITNGIVNSYVTDEKQIINELK